MDTLFQFVDAHLFATLIDLKDKGEHEFLDFKTYEEMYKHIRECVDLCHRDGVIKDEVARDPEKYIVLDDGLIPMLKRYRRDGVKVFLLTNSLWEYTSTAMNFLYHGKRLTDEEQKNNEWLELFDLVVVGSCKPAYMLDPYLNLFRINSRDGSLLNTDGVYEIDALGEDGAAKFLAKGHVFQGGNWLHLQAMLEIVAGEEILYVGDHLYADVLRSKRTLGWRSAFIMPELEEEMRVFYDNMPLAKKIRGLRQIREELDIYGEELRLSQGDLDDKELQGKLALLEQEDALLKAKLTEMAEQWHASFHPVWGAMFNAGYQDSRFAFYVQNYACLYTSRATNLGLVTPARSFRTTLEILPHDRLLASPSSEFVDFEEWEEEEETMAPSLE
jgi:5'-nucleotidase